MAVGPQPEQPRQGWNAGTPPGSVRCACPARRRAWAMLNWRVAGTACCYQPCCREGPAPVAIMATRQEVWQLRGEAVQQAWACPRCGAPVAAHWRGFLCIDPLTRQIRETKARQGRPVQ